MNRKVEVLNIFINNEEVICQKINIGNKVLISLKTCDVIDKSQKHEEETLVCDYDFNIIDSYRERIVKNYIINLLHILELKKIQVDQKNYPIISKWSEYVEGYTEEENKDFLGDELYSNLKFYTDIFIKIFKSSGNKYLLLEDRFLSPEIISLKSEESDVILSYVEKIITSENKKSKIAVVNSPELNKVLSERMPKDYGCDLVNIKIEPTRINSNNEKIISEMKDFNYSAACLGQYDYIILFNNIHLYKEPFHIISRLEKMLKKGGKLIVTDFGKMNPIALLLGGFYNIEHLGVCDEIRNEFFYKKTYIEKLFKKKFEIVETKTLCDDRLYLIEGVCTNDYVEIIDNICKEIDIQAENLIILSDDMDSDEMFCISERIQAYNNDILSDNERIQELRGQYEEKLKSIWKINLENENLDFTKNYFELGGDSLLATKLLIKINEEFNCSINMGEFFKNLEFGDMLALIQNVAHSEESIIYGEI